MTDKVFSEALGKAIITSVGGSFLTSENILWKIVDGGLVGKPAASKKDLSWDWIENISNNDIDTRYFNLDGTKK